MEGEGKNCYQLNKLMSEDREGMRFDEWSCMKLCSDCRTCGLCIVVAIDMT